MPWSSINPITPGRICFTLTGLNCLLGPYLADWNETHIYNPRWPPHAKFHNGQTMTFGALLGMLTLYNSWRKPTPSQETVWTTAIFGGIYWLAGLSAILYPGTKACDPEFGETNAQLYLFGTLLAVDSLGWWLESSRLASLGIN